MSSLINQEGDAPEVHDNDDLQQYYVTAEEWAA